MLDALVGRAGDQTRFAATPGLKLRVLGDDVVVFHPVSWDAHILNQAASITLEACLGSAVSVDQVATELVEYLDEGSRPDASEHAARILGELEHLGLIAVVPNCAGP